jgi:hypothetical protein
MRPTPFVMLPRPRERKKGGRHQRLSVRRRLHWRSRRRRPVAGVAGVDVERVRPGKPDAGLVGGRIKPNHFSSVKTDNSYFLLQVRHIRRRNRRMTNVAGLIDAVLDMTIIKI